MWCRGVEPREVPGGKNRGRHKDKVIQAFEGLCRCELLKNCFAIFPFLFTSGRK